jgi:MFS family permease
MVSSFLVVYAASTLGSNAANYGYLVAALAGAGAAGAILVGRIRGRRFAGILMGASVTAQAGGVALLVLGRTLPTAIAGVAALGLTIGLINTVYYATMQAIVPNEILARVLSIDSVGSFVAIPGGLIVGGLLTTEYGIRLTYAIAAVGLLANGLVLLALPRVRSLRYGS